MKLMTPVCLMEKLKMHIIISKIYNKSLFLLFILLLSLNIISPAYGFVGVPKSVIELSIPAIKSIAALGKDKGSKYVANELAREFARLAKTTPASQMKYFYEVNYLKILSQQKRISPAQMEEYFKNLKDVKGFRSTLSKMVGKNTSLGTNVNAIGHGFELEVANTLAKSKFKVLSLGDKFDDGIKLAKTDIDILAEKGGKKFAFELKNYNNTYFKIEERAKFYGDIKSMGAYAKQNKDTQSVFLMKNIPDKDTMAHLVAMGKSENVLVGFGDPSTFIKMFLEGVK